MGLALMRAVQRHNVMVCAKHFALNSIENSRYDVDVSLSERALREVYLPHFKKLVDGGVDIDDERLQQVPRRVLRPLGGAPEDHRCATSGGFAASSPRTGYTACAMAPSASRRAWTSRCRRRCTTASGSPNTWRPG